jgi:hypothetical protein
MPIRYLFLLSVILLAAAVPAVAAAGRQAGSGEVSMAPPPKAWTTNAYGVEGSEAVIAGFINPRGQRTIFWFQYGPTKSYGKIAPEALEDEFFGNQRREVEAGLDCLQPKTTYHFRIVAKNRSGKAFGSDRTFTTTRLHSSIPSLYGECPKKDWPGR